VQEVDYEATRWWLNAIADELEQGRSNFAETDRDLGLIVRQDINIRKGLASWLRAQAGEATAMIERERPSLVDCFYAFIKAYVALRASGDIGAFTEYGDLETLREVYTLLSQERPSEGKEQEQPDYVRGWRDGHDNAVELMKGLANGIDGVALVPVLVSEDGDRMFHRRATDYPQEPEEGDDG